MWPFHRLLVFHRCMGARPMPHQNTRCRDSSHPCAAKRRNLACAVQS
ncbi:UNVERIFIED_CONTAM: hypothetical protein GTU68_063454 [Idotea baltica]|nr:hypothetical protein [Idotea baltica]